MNKAGHFGCFSAILELILILNVPMLPILRSIDKYIKNKSSYIIEHGSN